MYLEKSVKEYTELVVRESSYPGSESTLALTSALATSLLLVYFRRIYKNKTKAQEEERQERERQELKKIIERIITIKEELLNTVDEASLIYRSTSRPKGIVIKEAAIIPLLVAQKCNTLLELTIAVDEQIKLNLIETRCAAELFAGVYKINACLMGSLACVKINLQELEKGDLYNFIEEERKKLLKIGEQNYNKILKTINNSNIPKE